MRIRLTAPAIGPNGGQIGDERDVPDVDAARMIAAGYAVPVRSRKMERAVRRPAAQEE